MRLSRSPRRTGTRPGTSPTSASRRSLRLPGHSRRPARPRQGFAWSKCSRWRAGSDETSWGIDRLSRSRVHPADARLGRLAWVSTRLSIMTGGRREPQPRPLRSPGQRYIYPACFARKDFRPGSDQPTQGLLLINGVGITEPEVYCSSLGNLSLLTLAAGTLSSGIRNGCL